MSRGKKTICLGAEYDDRLRETLMLVLGEMGALMHEHARGVAGSQELETVKAAIDGEDVEIEAETYMGLSVRGEEGLVDEIAERVRTRLIAAARAGES